MNQEQTQIQKIYTMAVVGGDDSVKKVVALNAAFDALRESKKLLNAELEKALVDKKSTEEIDRLNKAIKETDTQLKSVSVQRQKSEKDAKASAQAEKILADIKLQEARATKEQALAGKARTQDMIAQEKELDRLIAKEERQNKNAQQATGLYNRLKAELSELYKLVQSAEKTDIISFRGNNFSYDQAIAKVKVLSAAEQDFRRQFSKDNLLVSEYTTGIIQAFKNMGLDDLIKGQVQKAEARIGELNTTFKTLQQEYQQIKNSGVSSFDAIEKEMVQNRAEVDKIKTDLQGLNTRYHTVGDVGTQVTNGLKEGFKNVRKEITQFALGYFGFQQILFGLTKTVKLNEELSDTFAQLRIFLHGTDDDVNTLVNSLKKIDTRTSLTNLADIATVVAKKGVAKQEIAGVTQALDQLFVVLGKEIGDPHEAVSSLVKLVNVYSEDKHVTAKNIGDIGAAIQKLTSSGVATGGFLISFAERMAGVRGVTGLTIQSVLGLGAALEELGQRNEVAGTAAQQLIVQMFLKPAQYAKAAGLEVKEFTKLLSKDPVEALIKIAKSMKDVNNAPAELVEAFSQLNIHGARVFGVLGDIAGNADYMRKRLNDSSKAFGDQASLMAANEVKQHTFAATMERVSKQFEVLGSNRSVQAVLLAIAGALSLLIANLPTVLVLSGLLAASWVVQNSGLLLLRGSMLVYNLLIARNYALMGILYATNLVVNAGLLILNGTFALITRAAALFNITLSATPLGLILTGIVLLGSGMAAFAGVVNGASSSLQKHNRELQLQKDITQEATAATADLKAKAFAMSQTVKDLTISEQTRKKALQELIAIDPVFQKTLVDGKINIKNLNEALAEYNGNLQKKAELEASQSRQQKEYQELVRLQTIKQNIEFAKSQGKGFGDISGDERQFFGKFETHVGRSYQISKLFNASINEDDFKKALASVDEAIKKQSDLTTSATDLYTKKYAENNKKAEEAITNTTTAGDVFTTLAKAADEKLSVKELHDLIKTIDDQYDTLKEGDPKLARLQAFRDKFEERLNKLNGKEQKKGKAYGGAKLSGEDKDALRNIDAGRDQALASEKLARITNQEDEVTYLQNILKINNDALDKKIALLKKGDAIENKLREEYKLQKIENEQKTSQEIFKIQDDLLTKRFDNAKSKEEQFLQLQEDNPLLNDTQKANAKVAYYDKLLTMQEGYHTAERILEKNYGIDSIANEEKRTKAIEDLNFKLSQAKIHASRTALQEDLKNIDNAAQRAVNEQEILIANRTEKILLDNKLSNRQKAKALRELEKEETKNVLVAEVAGLKLALDQKKALLAGGLITETEFSNAKIQLRNKELALLKKTTDEELSLLDRIKAGFTKASRNALGLKDFQDEQEKADAAWAEAANTAKNAINTAYQAYFNNQNAAVDKRKQDQLDFIDKEKQKVLAYASSSEEKVAIEARYEARENKLRKKPRKKKDRTH
jgi:hypothetical protein